MRRAWTRLWLSASAVALLGANAKLLVSPSFAATQSGRFRANELTLAGLRPGRSTISRALKMYKYVKRSPNDNIFSSHDVCFRQMLTITPQEGTIQTIRVSDDGEGHTTECLYRNAKIPPNRWVTGRGLEIGDPRKRVIDLYGEPDSVSPSTKDGKPLELLYYAFDWAGPDVPQVMEVVCTREKNGKPGRVVEIMLAAPSL